MKKYISVFVAAALCLTFSSALAQEDITYRPEDNFTDVPPGHPDYRAIMYFHMDEGGVIGGYSDKTFKPDATINRAEFIKIIESALRVRLPAVAMCDLPSDVPKTAWFAPAVCAAFEDGVIGGYPDGTIHPATPISFVEAAKIISLAQSMIPDCDNVTGENCSASSVSKEPWYKKYVLALEKKSAIPLDIQSFSQPITRGQMVQIFYRSRASIQPKPSSSYAKLLAK